VIPTEQRVASFSSLGQVFEIAAAGVENSLGNLVENVKSHNGWFTPENVRFALSQWAKLLKADQLNAWIQAYQFPETTPKTIGIIMAGNIPLVGFHDLLCVVLSGNKALVKLSSKDTVLMKEVIQTLLKIEPGLAEYIKIEEAILKDFDAIIATGSDNSSRYFDYYFGKYPHIIRKNRTSVAIIRGNETQEDFKQLGWDIFRYFGLGCRNVTKLFVPKDYDFSLFFEGISIFRFVLENNKYANNYDYNKAIFLLNKTLHLDNGFLLIKEDSSLFTPAGLVHFEPYSSEEELQQKLNEQASAIQCIVSKNAENNREIPLGTSQMPGLNQYADGIDTLSFLSQIAS
jgi:hypothetical protein